MFKQKWLVFAFVFILTVLTILLLFTGCGTPPAANRWTKLLSVIPADEFALESAFLFDSSLMTDMMNQYPPAEPFKTSLDSYYFPASGGSFPNAQYYNDADWQKDLGFVQADVEMIILAGGGDIPPVKYYQAAKVQFDSTEVDNAVRTGSLHEQLEVINYHGQDYYSTGPDNKIDLTVQSGAHHMGMAYRMALVDDVILWSNMTAPMEGMIDSYKNKIDSLADVKDYQSLSQILADSNAFYAFFSSGSYSLSHIKQAYEEYKESNQLSDATIEQSDKRLAALEKAVLLEPFNALASGVGLDANGYYLIIALANTDKATAERNAILLEQRLNQSSETDPEVSRWAGFMNGKREISVQGNITVVQIYGDAYKLWYFSSMVYQSPMWGFITDAFIVTE